MPGIPAVSRETSYSRSTDQTSLADARVNLSAEEELAAEESLSTYCKPVELYNILQRRAIRNPSFLQRCLLYKIKAKQKKRIQMTVSLSRSVNETQSVFPLYICLARMVSDVEAAEYSAVCRVSRFCIYQSSSGVNGNTEVRANFILPEVSKLAVEAKSRKHAILFVSTVGNPNSSSELNASLLSLEPTTNAESAEIYCFCGKVSLESLYMAWDGSPNFSLGQRAEMMSTVDLVPCILKCGFQKKNRRISIQVPSNSENVSTSKQVQITISAEEFGANEKSPYYKYASSEVLTPSLAHFIRLREGNVMFHYRYFNNKLQRTEVTENFSCPFCLVRCASFKGLRCHLSASHDLFNFEFWISEECQAVNVSVKNDIWRSEIVADGVDPKLQTFFFCGKPFKRGRPKNPSFKNSEDVPPLVLESDCPAGDPELLEKADGVSNAIVESHSDPDCVQPISDHELGTPSVLQIAKTGKSSVERSDPRICALLRKRQFYHSHKAQPMSLEEVLSDQDSEDDVDDDVADYEDRRMLDNFVDVDDYEKQIMHMWNTFVRKQRVLADGHVPWACEAFTKLHGPDFIQCPPLAWRWRLLMVKLWNHGLLDGKTFNECSLVLERYRKLNSDPKN